MITRILFALPLLLLFIPIIIGGLPLYLLETGIMLIGLNEFYKAFENKHIFPIKVIGYLFSIYILVKNQYALSSDITIFLLLCLFLISVLTILSNKHNFIDLSITFAGMIYVCIFVDFIALIINNFDKGNLYVWIVFIIAVATDTFAYFIGYLFGKHKLIPKVSPKKTIEGSVGGIVASVIICCAFAYVFDFKIGSFAILGFVGSIAAQVGDLLASSIKRFVGIKDYGNLIPGHGGVLDRIDSIIFIAPFIYYLLLFSVK